MSKGTGSNRQNVYQSLLQRVEQAEFVEITCFSREMKEFTILAALLEVFEKKMVKYEVIWNAQKEKASTAPFGVFVGFAEEYPLHTHAIITTHSIKAPSNMLLLQEETPEEIMFSLYKQTGHKCPAILWCICICIYATGGHERKERWNQIVRAYTCEESSDDSSEHEVRKKNDLFCEHLEIEIDRLGKQKIEKKEVEIQEHIFFPFCCCIPLYEALGLDLGVAEELGLYSKKNLKTHRALDPKEYLLNRFLARIGISLSVAKGSSLSSTTGAVQKIIAQSFLPRTVYYKHYEYNRLLSHVEAFFCIESLISNGDFTQALLAFKDQKHINMINGLSSYSKCSSMVQRALSRRRYTKIEEMETIIIPKHILSFHWTKEINLIREIFWGIHRICKQRHPYREVLVVVEDTEKKNYRILHASEGLTWAEAKEEEISERMKEIIRAQ
ncbi:hypothetical protein NEFER03_1961 [Nematocida sp. LUAm3]|nr:hypothetical protein NEFER03_1961 [Nematocida sp. LUAm3]KAI5176045.1 hypothetical protein NEFER02_1879 [Nematocida sp. LUAm2]KAI5177089.1 hypothetical protein NEFER01_0364 [Nematocida sp. LUAm1]